MRRLLGGPFEALHVLGTAFFFGVAVLLALFSSPEFAGKAVYLTPETAAERFHAVASSLGTRGVWIAGAACVGAVIAPYAPFDGRKLLAWLRIFCAAATLVIVLLVWGDVKGAPRLLEGDVESETPAAEAVRGRSDAGVTPWNALLAATALNLVLGAFQMAGGAAAKPEKK